MFRCNPLRWIALIFAVACVPVVAQVPSESAPLLAPPAPPDKPLPTTHASSCELIGIKDVQNTFGPGEPQWRQGSRCQFLSGTAPQGSLVRYTKLLIFSEITKASSEQARAFAQERERTLSTQSICERPTSRKTEVQMTVCRGKSAFGEAIEIIATRANTIVFESLAIQKPITEDYRPAAMQIMIKLLDLMDEKSH